MRRTQSEYPSLPLTSRDHLNISISNSRISQTVSNIHLLNNREQGNWYTPPNFLPHVTGINLEQNTILVSLKGKLPTPSSSSSTHGSPGNSPATAPNSSSPAQVQEAEEAPASTSPNPAMHESRLSASPLSENRLSSPRSPKPSPK
jgi:hypothetical protein